MMFSNNKFALTVVSIVFAAAGPVRTWDLGVVTPAQLQFFNNKTVETSAADRLKDMVAIAYDPVKKDVYVSDANQKVGSIFRIKTTGDEAYTAVEPIVAKQSATVQGMAFDHRTSTLYWTTGNGLSINYVYVPENSTEFPLTGRVLFKFKDIIPQGIAIDTCKGYLYWTNCNHLNATIERSRLDGSEHTVLIHEQLFQPLGIAVDAQNGLLYWSDEREGMYYSIDTSDLEGGSRRTLIHGTHHQPFSIALDERNIYWSDWVNDAVWTMPKDSFQGGVQPTLVVKYESIETPMGLITPKNPMLINDTKCIAATRTNNDTGSTMEATLQESDSYEALRNLCKTNGILHVNGSCTCAPGYEGEFCATHVCQDYCASGTCSVDSTGRPQCQCQTDTAGERCERKTTCPGGCQNGGQCQPDKDGRDRCDCPVGYTGNMCQTKLSDYISELCSVYCQLSNPRIKTASAVCSCEEYGHHYDYSNMELSSCKLSKTMTVVVGILFVMVACLGTTTLVLAKRVRFLGRRPRIKKRIVVNKSITPLQSCRPPQQQNQQCEITIENCCNMNICETPCFEPDYRPPKLGGLLQSLSRSKKEDKANLLSNTDMSSEDEKPPY